MTDRPEHEIAVDIITAAAELTRLIEEAAGAGMSVSLRVKSTTNYKGGSSWRCLNVSSVDVELKSQES